MVHFQVVTLFSTILLGVVATHLSPLGVSRRPPILGLLRSAGVPDDMWLLLDSSGAVVGASGAAADLDGFTPTPPDCLLLDSIMM